ncbi:MAG: GreA/GreB family elongation factor [Patescibacteria group bacterium]
MQIPYRKPGKFSQMKTDPLITKEKFAELEKELAHLKKIQPAAAAEVSQLAELGDFSENVEYQLAKGRLRGIIGAITKLNSQLNHAEIIQPDKNSNTVQLGNKVTIARGKAAKTFLILGSEESDPKNNIISHNSPLGVALMGRRSGDNVLVKLVTGEVEYKIIKIE